MSRNSGDFIGGSDGISVDFNSHRGLSIHLGGIERDSFCRPVQPCDTLRPVAMGFPELGPVRVDTPCGGAFTIDEFNRITAFSDPCKRDFRFGYDRHSGELNSVVNENGHWKRDCHHGCYSNEWKNENGDLWRGSVSVGRDGYSYRDDRSQIRYNPDGTRVEERFDGSAVYFRDRLDRDGNRIAEDLRTNKANITYADGRTAVRDLNNNSFLGYDREGRLLKMRDGAGREFRFGDYDSDGKPRLIQNETGIWHKTGRDQWRSKDNRALWFGDVQVDKNGSYSFTDSAGNKTSYNLDGTKTVLDRGLTTSLDAHGNKVETFADGSPVKGDAVTGSVKFKVVKGETRQATLSLKGADGEIVHGNGDVHAHIRVGENAPVAALQDGRIVYSYSHDPAIQSRNEASANQVIGLSPEDLNTIDRLKQQNPSQDIVVMQCYDKESRGVRYQIYSGLGYAGRGTGQTVRAGELIGRAGADGYSYSVRRQRVSGPVVPLSLAGQHD